MTPLIFLFGTFGILFAVNKFLLNARLNLSFIGRAAMAMMLIVTGIAHFTLTNEMAAMMPDQLPAKREIIYFTGVCELLAVVGLLWNRMAKLTSVMLIIIFFAAVLPANILGSIKQVKIGGMDYGVWYLLFRVPLQIFFIWWVYYFGIRIPGQNHKR
ncbi:MAG: DoxX family protein [Acidobacteriota bacterium]|nr:DoxX family protein [Acidobacteriota bacterium]